MPSYRVRLRCSALVNFIFTLRGLGSCGSCRWLAPQRESLRPALEPDPNTGRVHCSDAASPGQTFRHSSSASPVAFTFADLVSSSCHQALLEYIRSSARALIAFESLDVVSWRNSSSDVNRANPPSPKRTLTFKWHREPQTPTPTHTTPDQQAEQARSVIQTRAQTAGRSTRATPPTERHWLARPHTTLLDHPVDIT